MKFSISLPEATAAELFNRVTALRLEQPLKCISVSEVVAKHLDYAFKQPIAEVIT